MTTKKFNVPDVSCAHCKNAIESALGNLEGVNEVEVDVEAKVVDVAFDEAKIPEDKVRDILAEEGYPVAS